MEDASLYQRIAEAVRSDILAGRYKPGDRLPPVRLLCARWNCTPGTVQRAYRQLAREGLLVSRAGRGTRVAGEIPHARAQVEEALRRAGLVKRMETALLEALTAGYDLTEIQQAMDLAMDRWRTLSAAKPEPPGEVLRFVGSHDMVVNELAHHFFGRVIQHAGLQLSYTGSLGGLIALAEGRADLAGCHLWDAETGSYNLPFVRRVLPNQDAVVVTLAHRRQGLLVAPGNPRKIEDLADLAQPGIRFVNRQPGSGTRIWLDSALARQGIDPRQIEGYQDERLTHSDVARAVAEGEADAGLGLESAGRAFGLDFVFLLRERYDLILRPETAQNPALQALIQWLASESGKQFVASHAGYESQETGRFQT